MKLKRKKDKKIGKGRDKTRRRQDCCETRERLITNELNCYLGIKRGT